MKEIKPISKVAFMMKRNITSAKASVIEREHLCDVVIRFENGVVNMEKNRFGKVGENEINT